MAKVTSKLQLTLPKRLAEQVGIAAGDEVDVAVAGEGLRIAPTGRTPCTGLSAAERLRLFHEASARQAVRDQTLAGFATPSRDWTREELYRRGEPR
ncbi:MAG: AbrB/MazE/SpoVT family DNA-binding domain-containing protein [Gammaproteobacteria bacterium]|jgi:AbrB family looped-hinge helix DNA binding protein|nr:AbrB/MazE/SpoVT family DNA-binding domain-containing protein [Gammaproteobacteria bacterium]